MKVIENKRLHGGIRRRTYCFVLSREHIDAEKRWCSFPALLFSQRLMLLAGKKKKMYLVIANLPKLSHSERETTSFLSPLLLPPTSIHCGAFLRWLSLSHPLVMEDFAVCL